MNKKEMLLKLEKQLEILTKRKRNLKTKMELIDDLPVEQITKDTYKEWHIVYCKVNYLALRIETIKNKMEMIVDSKDIVKSVISGSKGLFNYLRNIRRAN